MKIKHIVFLVLTTTLLAFNMHKMYVSICNVEYVKKQQAVQITLSIFIDDLELALKNENNINLNIATKIEHQQVDYYFKKYLQKHLKIEINGKTENFDYIGKEYEDDLVRFFLEIPSIKQFKSFKISNTILFSEFEDQKNIVKVKIEKEHKTIYLDSKNPKEMLNF